MSSLADNSRYTNSDLECMLSLQQLLDPFITRKITFEGDYTWCQLSISGGPRNIPGLIVNEKWRDETLFVIEKKLWLRMLGLLDSTSLRYLRTLAPSKAKLYCGIIAKSYSSLTPNFDLNLMRMELSNFVSINLVEVKTVFAIRKLLRNFTKSRLNYGVFTLTLKLKSGEKRGVHFSVGGKALVVIEHQAYRSLLLSLGMPSWYSDTDSIVKFVEKYINEHCNLDLFYSKRTAWMGCSKDEDALFE